MYPKSYTDSMVYGQRRDLMRGILSFTVLNERLLVKELTEDWVTKAGLIIPEHLRAEEEYFSWGLVLQVGERVTEDVVAGDRILFEPLTGVPNGEGALFVWQRYVWAVIEDDPEVEA